jgi:hypothetical protein
MGSIRLGTGKWICNVVVVTCSLRKYIRRVYLFNCNGASLLIYLLLLIEISNGR